MMADMVEMVEEEDLEAEWEETWAVLAVATAAMDMEVAWAAEWEEWEEETSVVVAVMAAAPMAAADMEEDMAVTWEEAAAVVQQEDAGDNYLFFPSFLRRSTRLRYFVNL